MTMFKDKIKARGDVTIELRGPDGKLKERREIRNLLVTVGLGYIASRMKDATATAMSHMAVGSDNTAAAAGNTTLGTELGRVALTSTTVAANVITYAATFGAGTGTGDVKEAGLFNAGAAGTLLARTVFGIVTKAAGDSLTISWAITITAA